MKLYNDVPFTFQFLHLFKVPYVKKRLFLYFYYPITINSNIWLDAYVIQTMQVKTRHDLNSSVETIIFIKIFNIHICGFDKWMKIWLNFQRHL